MTFPETLIAVLLLADWQDRHLLTNRIRGASAALLFLGCLVSFTSAFNLPNRSPALSSQLASLSRAAKPAQQRTTLTLADRVAYQRAIEEVYWRHRIWPTENSKPKPSLDEVMSAQQIEKKVENYLGDSQALEDYWQKPIAPEQLQAEMERMARHTKQPEVLGELFEALGNDPSVIAECLAMPVLAERLVADLSAHDKGQRFALLRTQAAGSKFSMTTSGRATYTLPEIDPCTDDTWTPTSVISAPDGRQFHTAVWPGSEMIIWGGNTNPGGNLDTGGRYDPATDSWTATSTTNAPLGREYHTAVWTGSEMIIWGGAGNDSDLNSGGRYNPSTDSWTATNIAGAPAGRADHTAVWTGSEMIVWGGTSFDGQNNHYLNSGGRYNPGTDSWTATSTTNAPLGRLAHTAVWTASEMIIWGGYYFYDGSNHALNTGGRYNPGTDSWTPTSITDAPLGREYHTAVWTGSEMIIWAGYYFYDGTNHYLNTGGRYNLGTDSWTATSTTDAPEGRGYHTAVWTGSEIIVWGGFDNDYLNTGGRYDPGTDSWTATSTTNAPSARYLHTAVWTGSEMIMWGGYDGSVDVNTGGRYCAQSQALMAQSAFSRKIHGAAGIFDIPLPLTGNVGIECRSGGVTNDYQMIINFMTTVTVESASVTSGTGSVSSFSVNGSQVTVNLTGVTNVQRITVMLINVNDGTHMGNVPVSMGVLIGDTNGNAVVNAADVALTKSQVGMAVSSSNFREDVNTSGTISATDVAIVKSDVGHALPP
jgi:N-acetylneuraminic acid mutarotase